MAGPGAPLGNNNAGKAKEWQLALRRVMARKADGDFRKTLEKIAETVIDAALAGDKDAWKDVADREDGKPAQSVHVGNADGLPFKQITEFVDRIVDPRDASTAGIQAAVTARDV